MRRSPVIVVFSLLLVLNSLAPVLPAAAAARWDGSIFFGHFGETASEELDFLLPLAETWEVIPLGQGEEFCRAYIEALDQGGHPVPILSGGGRTAVPADSLEAIPEAMAQRRAYATEDCDLLLCFTLEGHSMGTQLAKWQVGDRVTVEAQFRDPTDSGGATLEILTDGGMVLAACALGGDSGKASFSLDSGFSYYFLRLTQADGHRAVTAPVWIRQTEEAGIAGFLSSPEQPVRGQETLLTVTLYNKEETPLLVDSLTLFREGEAIHRVQDLTVPAGETLDYGFPWTHTHLGDAEFRVEVTAALDGRPRSYEAALRLTCRPSETVPGVYIDAAHENAGLDRLTEFSALAEKAGRPVRFVDRWEDSLLGGANILLVTAPGSPLSQEFLAFAKQFTALGGTLVVCGQSDGADGAVHTAYELNRLLEALGAELRLSDDTLRDPVENSGRETDVVLSNYRTDSHWYVPALADRVFRQREGCTVTGGTWLVKGGKWAVSQDADGDGGGSSAVALAWEPTGGGLWVSGGLFLEDSFLREPTGIWQEPYANRSFAQGLFEAGQEELSLTPLNRVRSGTEGRTYRIRGHITAGSGTFPGVLYVQDETGGIALSGVTEAVISIGTPVEAEGVLSSDGGNPLLVVEVFEVLQDSAHRCQPVTGAYSLMMDTALHGGQLVQLQGKVVYTEGEGDALREFLLTDGQGRYATVSIETVSHSTGRNDLARTVRMGREVRAVGILYLREDGVAALRVRDCDEVTLLSDWPYADNEFADPTNPPTGDPIGGAILGMVLAAVLLTGLTARKKATGN